MIIITALIGGALPWISMYLDSLLHGYNVRGPWSKFGAPFMIGALVMFVISTIMIAVEVQGGM